MTLSSSPATSDQENVSRALVTVWDRFHDAPWFGGAGIVEKVLPTGKVFRWLRIVVRGATPPAIQWPKVPLMVDLTE